MLVVLTTLVALVLATQDAKRVDSSVDWLPLIESAINDLVFAGIAVFFLLALSNRLKRGHLLALLHRPRSLAHIGDMHQLTKDPERLRQSFTPPEASPDLDLGRAGMEHYLDYCSELPNLIGTVAALSRKIWQQISLLPD